MKNKRKNELEFLKKIQVNVLSTFGHCGIDHLHSLLDSHKDLLIIPAISIFRILELAKIDTRWDSKKIAKRLLRTLYKTKYVNTERREFIFSLNEKKKFEKELIFALEYFNKEKFYKKFLLSIHFAYCKIKKKNFFQYKSILVHEHVPWHLSKYKEIFKSKILIILRNPHASLAGSLKSFRNTLNYVSSYNFELLIFMFLSADKELSKISINKFIVLNEKLNLNTKKTLTKICKFLNINFQKSCLVSTLQGKKWNGETAYKNSKFFLDKNFYSLKEVNKRWKKVLKKDEILMFEIILNNIFVKYRYKRYFSYNLKNILLGYFYFFTKFHFTKREFMPNFYILFFLKNFVRRILLLINLNLFRRLLKFI
jgi:hypothetical protein